MTFDLQFFSQERTEPATPRKRRKEREEGRVAKSQDLGAAAVILVGLFALMVFGRFLFSWILAFTTDADQRDWMSTAIVSWPAGAMAGLAAIYLALPGPPRRRSATDRSDGGVGEVTQVIG